VFFISLFVFGRPPIGGFFKARRISIGGAFIVLFERSLTHLDLIYQYAPRLGALPHLACPVRLAGARLTWRSLGRSLLANAERVRRSLPRLAGQRSHQRVF